METWERIFTSATRELGCPPGDEQLRLFSLYRSELLLWNRKMSLLSLKSPEDLPLKHFADSLTVLPLLSLAGAGTSPRLLDLGTGAGLPGIPLLIMQPSLRLVLLDSSRKKASFLKEILRKLHRSDIPVINERLEAVMAGGDYLEAFDMVLSRATFSLDRLLPPAAHFLTPGGMLIAMKSRTADRELIEARTVQSSMVYEGRRDLELPRGAGRRSLLLFRKSKNNQSDDSPSRL